MSEDLRTLREHLADPRLYAEPGAPAPARPATWRAALLARYPAGARYRRPLGEGAHFWRLVLLIALPLAVATAVTLLAMAGVDLTPPRLALPLGPGAAPLLRNHAVPLYAWYGLAGLSALLTFLVRGRVPRLLPVDW